MPLISEHAPQVQPFLVHHFPRHLFQLFQTATTTAALPYIQVGQHIDHHAVLARHRRQVLHVLAIIHDHQKPRLTGQIHCPPHRNRIDDFIGDHHLGNSRVHHHFGFTDGCAAQAHRSGAHLQMTDRRRFVCLGVWTQLCIDLGKIVGHGFHVAGHDFDIDHQRRGRQF